MIEINKKYLKKRKMKLNNKNYLVLKASTASTNSRANTVN